MPQYFSQEFQCTRCNLIQEQLVTNKDHDAEDPCKGCSAPKQELSKVISVTGQHVSWSQWRVDLA